MSTRLPTRSMLIAIAASLVVGVSGCTTAFQNAQQCKQQMVATYPQSGPALSFERTAVANRGSRVVVEATYRVPNTAPQTTIVKPRTAPAPAAVECVFDGERMTGFQWLAPPKMVSTTAQKNQDTE
jgi:hypothetical protein